MISAIPTYEYKGLTMSANNTVKCPSCAQRMRLIQRTRRFGELPENLCTFECRACGVSLFEDTLRQRKTISKTRKSPWLSN